MILRIVLLLTFAVSLRATEVVEAVVVVIGDQHSAYDKYPYLLGEIDRLRADNPGVPVAVLIDGDAFEYGNKLSRRTNGEIDFALFAALAKRGPTVVNLGNHEPDLFSVTAVVQRIAATGVKVISANTRRRETGQPFAPPSVRLKLGGHDVVVVGLGTDALTTFRVAIRPQLDLHDPVVWARQNLAEELKGADVPIVLSHAGLRADRSILPLVPDGTLFAGAHDHLRFVHHLGKTWYFHSGSWLDGLSVARLTRSAGQLAWRVEQISLDGTGPVDPTLAKFVNEAFAANFTAAEQATYGHTDKAMSPAEAALFAVDVARRAAGADVAIIGATTFGAGLPAGDFTRYHFDNYIRFDGPLAVGEVKGDRLKAILAQTNQGPATPFEQRGGENLLATGLTASDLDPDKSYRLATSDWIARNAAKYLGENPPKLTELPSVRLKPAVVKALGGTPDPEPDSKAKSVP